MSQQELIAYGFRITWDQVDTPTGMVTRALISWPETGQTSPPFCGPYDEVALHVARWATAQLDTGEVHA